MQEQQRALKAAQQCEKVAPAKSAAVVTAVTSKEKLPGKGVDDVRRHLYSFPLIYAILYFLCQESECYMLE
jgi:hypothetical protein